MRTILVSLVCVLLLVGCGKHAGANDPGVKPPGGDSSVLSPIAGRYPILQINGDATATGFLTVRADTSGGGFAVESLPMASHPATPFSLFSTREVTTWSQDGNQITQSLGSGDTSTRISYLLGDGYLTVRSNDCQKGACTKTEVMASRGKVPGDAMSARDFFKLFRGVYKIQSAGGAPPHEGNDQTWVDPDSDPANPDLTTPFCYNGVCDSGDHFFLYDKTQVYRRQLDAGHAQYWLFLTNPKGGVEYYSLEESSGAFTFRNFQYKMRDGKVVCLEHVFKYAGPLPPQ